MPADDLPPSRIWQATVPELGTLDDADDLAERLLLHLHYAINWDKSWVANHRATYWTDILPSRVLRAAYQSDTLDDWWSAAAHELEADPPRNQERRIELALLLRQPSLQVITAFHDRLHALLLRVQIIAEAVSQQRNSSSRRSAE